jgi:peptidoglycan/xylan/chitin deacetylase (PgdA/CDA1 family)
MRAVSLEYHDVVDGAGPDASGFRGPGPASYKLDEAEFGRHLAAIAGTVRTLPTRGLDWLQDAKPESPLFLTFDDGGIAAYTHIGDALERYGWRGHFFVTAARIGTETFLSARQIRELHARGHVIGTHSYSHPTRMGACSREQILEEWQRSTDILADIVGEPVVAGSVPGGYYTRRVAEAAARAGLLLLFTSVPTTRCWTVDGCRILGRYSVRRWSTPAAASALADGRLMPGAAQWLLYCSLKLLRTLGGNQYTRFRQQFWSLRAGLPRRS